MAGADRQGRPGAARDVRRDRAPRRCPEDVAPAVASALALAFASGERVAVLLGQRLLGAKAFTAEARDRPSRRRRARCSPTAVGSVCVAGLGGTSWDVAAAGDCDLDLPLWGSMGAAAMVGFGIALAQPDAAGAGRDRRRRAADGARRAGDDRRGRAAEPDRRRARQRALRRDGRAADAHRARHRPGRGRRRPAGSADSRTIRDLGSVVAELRDAVHALDGPRFAAIKISPDRPPLVLPPRDGPLLARRLRGRPRRELMAAPGRSRVAGSRRRRRPRRRAGRAVPAGGGGDPRPARPRAVRRHALHDAAAGALVPPGDGAARRAHGRLGADRGLAAGAARGRRAPVGRLPRYAWGDPYDRLRSALGRVRDALRERGRAGGRLRRPQHARRPRRRAGRGPHVLRQEHDGDRARPRLVRRARRRRSPTRALVAAAPEPVPRRLRLLHALHRRLPDGRARRARRARRDRAACPTGRRAAADAPPDVADALEDRVYGCDICQDVCPWNAGPAKRRADVAEPGAEAFVSLADWLSGAATTTSRRRYERLYVPDRDPRYLRRNALVALGNGPARAPRARASRSPTAAIRCWSEPPAAPSAARRSRPKTAGLTPNLGEIGV